MSETPGSQLNESIDGAVEALLLVSERALTPAFVADTVAAALTREDDDPGAQNEGLSLAEFGSAEVEASVERLNAVYEETGRAFRIERVAGGLRVMTRPEHAAVVAQFRGAKRQTGLSRAALETLSIIAYKQPVTRAQLEAIRGVACGEILRSLTERRLVKIAGRADELGRPILYATTKQFLETFGLPSLKDLPEVDQASPWERFRDAEAAPEAGSATDEPDDGDAIAEVDKAGAAGQ